MEQQQNTIPAAGEDFLKYLDNLHAKVYDNAIGLMNEMKDHKKCIASILEICDDVSERKRLTDEYFQYENMIAEFDRDVISRLEECDD